MKRKILSGLLVLAIMVSSLPILSLSMSAEGSSYAALGDSITTGYGLSDQNQGFVSLLAGKANLTAVNAAQTGATSADLKAKVTGGTLDTELRSVNLITITIGGNDLMNALYNGVAAALGKTPEEAKIALISNDMTALMAASAVIAGFSTGNGLDAVLTEFTSNFQSTISYIRAQNSSAAIVVCTQYQPYQWLWGQNALFTPANTGMNIMVEKLNAIIRAGASGSTAVYTVADCYTAFQEAYAAAPTVSLTNASAASLDFHPNTAGHQLIADTIAASLVKNLNPFTDVPADAWYYDSVQAAYAAKLMVGVGDGKFDPLGTTNRAMLVTTLYRLAGSPAIAAENSFTDVSKDDWYYTEVTWAAAVKLVEGYGDGRFGGLDDLTREQMVTILYRCAAMLGKTGTTAALNGFSDIDSISTYAVQPMEWAVASGIINGSEGKILPKDTATRAQLAAVLVRFTTFMNA